MPSFEVAVAWIVLSILAFLTDCLAVLAIVHYQPLYHSCDVAIISLLLTMAGNAGLLLTIPAVLKLGHFSWSQGLCSFYTWISLTLRTSHLLVLLVVNIFWMASLRMSNSRKAFVSSKPVKICVSVCWFLSVVVGIVPTADTNHFFGYFRDGDCNFLPASVDRGFAIFFMILSLVSAVMGGVSSLDTLLLFKSIKEASQIKYKTDRFHVPSISGRLQAGSEVHAKYNELNVSLELCRLVLWFSMASSVVNAVPLLASQFVQLILKYDLETMETTLLWLLLAEALTLPHLLWVLSRRYRHAVTYTCRLYLLRDRSVAEEDAMSCTLQAFRLKVKDVSVEPFRSGITLRQANGNMSRALEEEQQENQRIRTSNLQNGVLATSANGHAHQIPTTLVAYSQQSRHIEPSSVELVLVHENGVENLQGRRGHIKARTTTSVIEHGPGDADRTSALNNTEDTCSTSSTPTKPSQVKRSTSASARSEWKEKMRKKHLPAIFFSKSLQDEPDSEAIDYSAYLIHRSNDNQAVTQKPQGHPMTGAGERRETMNKMSAQWSSLDSTYYLSGDFHHELINQTFSRANSEHVHDDEDSIKEYDDEDIRNILDDSIASEQSKKESYSKTNETTTLMLRPADTPATTSRDISNKVIIVPYGENGAGNHSHQQESTSVQGTRINSNGPVKTIKYVEKLGVYFDDTVAIDYKALANKQGLQNKTLTDTQDASSNNTRAALDKNQSEPVILDHAVLDYSRLENVSGSEMLRLKMKSLRSATAFYSSDDTDDDDDGIENKGFDFSENKDTDRSLSYDKSSGQTEGNAQTYEIDPDNVRRPSASGPSNKSTGHLNHRNEHENKNNDESDKVSNGQSNIKESSLSKISSPVLYTNVPQPSSQLPQRNTIYLDSSTTEDLLSEHSRQVSNNSDQSEVTETDSVVSSHSVTLEPYGRRTPAWMQDALLTSSYSSDQHTTNQFQESDDEEDNNFLEDFPHRVTHYLHSFPTHTHFSNTEEVGLSPGYPSHLDRIPPDIGTSAGFPRLKDTVIDDVDQPSYYRGVNLCFESIKEESEDSLSETSSLADSHVTSNSRLSALRHSASPPRSKVGPRHRLSRNDKRKHSGSIESSTESSPSQASDKSQPVIPTSQRTSADGSDDSSLVPSNNLKLSKPDLLDIPLIAEARSEQANFHRAAEIDRSRNGPPFKTSLPSTDLEEYLADLEKAQHNSIYSKFSVKQQHSTVFKTPGETQIKGIVVTEDAPIQISTKTTAYF